MRCRNCHTVMMDADLACPSCRASVASATAAAPGPIAEPSNLLKVLPAFGGALGGLAYAALTYNSAGVPARGPSGPSGAPGGISIKWVIGILLVLVGAVFLMAAATHLIDTWKLSQREPKALTAAQLLQVKDPESMHGSWLAYTFSESKQTDLVVTRRRLGLGSEVKAPVLLVRVENKWLLAPVAPGFEGNQLVGRVLPRDPASPAIQGKKIGDVKTSTLLPFEFNGVDGCASEQDQRYIQSSISGGIGLLGLFIGLRMVLRRRRPQQQIASVPVKVGSFLPVAKG
jgi:hypothetical protein